MYRWNICQDHKVLIVALVVLSVSCAKTDVMLNGEKLAEKLYNNSRGNLSGDVRKRDEFGGKTLTEYYETKHGITLVSWRWDSYSDYVVVCVMILVARFVKVIFHETPILSKHFPESCNLIFLGILVGLFVYYGVESHSHHFPQ